MRVAGDQRFIVRKRHGWNIFEQVVTVACQISLETNCVEVSFLVKLHDWGSATFLQKQLTALDMVLNTHLSHKLSFYHYNADVCNDPNDYRSSPPEVFCKKGVLKNFAKFAGKHFCQNLFFNKILEAWRPATLFKKMTLAQVFSCEFCEISKTLFFIEHFWQLLL